MAARAGTLRRLHRIWLPLPEFPCPYCTRLLGSEGGRTRHITQSPSCSAAQARDIKHAQATRRAAREAGIKADFAGVPEEAKRRTSGQSLAIPEPAPPAPTSPPPPLPETPPPLPHVETIDEELVLGDMDQTRDDSCGQPIVEEFPGGLAGQPINEGHAQKPDLRDYMRARGVMSNPSHFEVAELLMTSGMTNEVRDRHLKSRKVSVIMCIQFVTYCAHSTATRHLGQTSAH